MHPILGHLRRLGMYLAAWIPLAAILLYLLASPGGLSVGQALVMVLPLCLVYAFMCLSAWYSCRGAPLGNSSFQRLALTHLLAAVVISGVWVAIGKGLATLLASFDVFRGLGRNFSQALPLLFVSGVMIYLLAVAMHYVLLSVEQSQQAEKRVIEARVLARDSELKALKAQVNPHFLFNSLNSISALTSIDAGRAREMCILLADFLRKTLGLGEKTVIPLREELALVHSFLSVEKVRFGARLRVEEKIAAEALEYAVPPLLLQPLVENAVAHGISNLTEGGWIRLEVRDGENRGGDVSGPDDAVGELVIEVENNFDPEMPRRRGTGVGLANVRQRLTARYGERARFDVRTEGERFRVTLALPAEKTEGAA
ncbi:MAG TPA: histidine kinase [Terriglobales bacterium]|nr:histidine kinase [Terriglobales bacterium]